ncbi:hypothetical protein RHGRI_007143 [Rhododendron griersonianum]|uniref:Uncharacterized protein n=1 Tax=Rhododendron griersonianum TaxID=479676 RepID=A0AAV6KWG4_9ERIC|nr:hypothetical protein RHGRI_007143 [Rhododendron griersonianum]
MLLATVVIAVKTVAAAAYRGWSCFATAVGFVMGAVSPDYGSVQVEGCPPCPSSPRIDDLKHCPFAKRNCSCCIPRQAFPRQAVVLCILAKATEFQAVLHFDRRIGAAAIDYSESSSEPSAAIVFHSNRWQLHFNDSKKIPKLSLGRGKRTRGNEKPKDLVHVRAGRGQATDSHSLAKIKSLMECYCMVMVPVFFWFQVLFAVVKFDSEPVNTKRNSKWKFLDSVKASGAPPPGQVIVQQCSSSKKFHPSKAVISFCTAVVVDVLGSLTTLDDDVVKRVLPYVLSELQLDAKGGLDLKDAKVQSKNDGSIYEILCRILDGNLDLSIDVSDSKIWFALEHPKVADRLRFDALHFLDFMHLAFSKRSLLVRRLDVCICLPALIDALENVLQRCLGIVMSKSKVKFEGFRIGQGFKVAIPPESYHSQQPREDVEIWKVSNGEGIYGYIGDEATLFYGT